MNLARAPSSPNTRAGIANDCIRLMPIITAGPQFSIPVKARQDTRDFERIALAGEAGVVEGDLPALALALGLCINLARDVAAAQVVQDVERAGAGRGSQIGGEQHRAQLSRLQHSGIKNPQHGKPDAAYDEDHHRPECINGRAAVDPRGREPAERPDLLLAVAEGQPLRNVAAGVAHAGPPRVFISRSRAKQGSPALTGRGRVALSDPDFQLLFENFSYRFPNSPPHYMSCRIY